MTDEELKVEWEYRYQERLGMLGVEDCPTMAQHEIAEQDEDKAIETLKFQALVDAE